MVTNRQSHVSRSILGSILIPAFLFLAVCGLNAATIVLKSGATVRGKMIDRTDNEIIIQDSATRQIRNIKNDQILNLTLEQDEGQFKKTKGGFVPGSGLLYVLQPELGILGGVAYPLDRVGKNLALGYGGNLFTDIAMPMKPEFFKIRLGLSAGYMYHPTKESDYAKYLNIIPIFLYAKFQFITGIGLRPYIKLGCGYTAVVTSGGNSSDLSAVGAIGLGYINKKIPFIEFFIEGGTNIYFEKTNAYMIMAHAGIAYRFGAGTNVLKAGK